MTGYAQDTWLEEKDLKPFWNSFVNGEFTPYKKNGGVVYLKLRDKEYKGGDLKIAGEYPIAVFLNHQLIFRLERSATISLDSLAMIYSNPLLFGLHSPGELSTILVRERAAESSLMPRPSDDFKDFTILISLLLIVFFTSLLYVNPKLTLDYFNVIRFLSIQEREETLTAIRTATSINFVYYLFTSLLISFLLMVLTHQSEIDFKFQWAQQSSFIAYCWHLTQLTIIIFFILLSKLLGVTLLARMFDIGEVAGFQFFNSIRVFLIASALISIFALVLFMTGFSSINSYFWILKFGLGIVAFGAVLLFLKLMPKVPFRFSHLFSYLCASEIIPLVILIKVLFK